MGIHVRPLEINDYQELKEVMRLSYGGLPGQYWPKGLIQKLIRIFPEGQQCVEADGKVVACALSIIVDYSDFTDDHNYSEITGNYTFDTHDPEGDVLYGIEVFVHPEYRGLRLGRRLYDERKDLCERLNLKSILVGGRIPNYGKYADELSPRKYIEKVRNKEIMDPVLTFQLSNDFHIRKIIKHYLPEDVESKEYATLLEWNNIYYQATEKKTAQSASIVRIGLVQWQMRPYKNIDDFFAHMEYFVDVVSDYKSDFVLFPEFFNAPLLSPYNHLPEWEAMRQLAEYTSQIREKMLEFAISYNVNIIGGSIPEMEDDQLMNISYLCRRDGTCERFAKIHITPNEQKYYGMSGGDLLRVFDTDCGKVGILVCYDVEFPELSRLLGEQGMQILFVPFLTDTQNGYMRVRNCAQARAIENECYVAIAGCVGNLPGVNNMDIQYAQSAVFTPSDFAFPTNAIKAEATPNTEMMILADVDLNSLKELHEFGTVRNMKDRRTDLYHLQWLAGRKL